MEIYSERYKKRCIKRLKEWGAPISDWVCIEVYDIVYEESESAGLFSCELCDCAKVRFVHIMRHEMYFEDVHVGCICAGIMDGDILGAKEREREMKNRAKRRENYLKRNWQRRGNGKITMKYKNRWITIMAGRYNNGGYGVICDGYSVWRHKGKRITSFLSAVHAAFDIVDPPIKVGVT